MSRVKLIAFGMAILLAVTSLAACGGDPVRETLPETKEETLTETVTETKPETSPETKAPETKTPETKAPETKTPETKAPETKAPETKAPETKAPETKAPETKKPETKAPETKAPETKAPETKAPETKKPETKAPETKKPETKAPETKKPETKAPETKAPETKAPETKAPETMDFTDSGKFVNAVCFMRTYEYFGKEDPSNKDTLRSQMQLYNSYNFPATYLYEYDALINKDYRDILDANLKSKDEVGIWFEIVEQMCEEAGIEWRSERNRSWDFYVNPGFALAYTTAEKHKLIDTTMAKFHEYYGYYPTVIGAWLLDSETMRYFAENYDIDAFLICRDQYGTDGYTLWGAPYYSPYYPSKSNSFMPAISEEDKIDVPVFRLYVDDPIYSYYESMDKSINKFDYGVFTEEATYAPTGQNKNWIKWMYKMLFGAKSSGISYIEIGQETPFGFGSDLANALKMQIEYTLDHREEYGYQIAKISDMAKSVAANREKLSKNVKVALTDWGGNRRQSVWYNNRNYRINIYNHKNNVYIRDLQYYGKENRDPYLDDPCKSAGAEYFCLPVIDGLRFSENSNSKLAGLYLTNGNIIDVIENGSETIIKISGDKKLTVILTDEKITIRSDDRSDFGCEFKYSPKGTASSVIKSFEETCVNFKSGTTSYQLTLEKGKITNQVFSSKDGEIVLSIH